MRISYFIILFFCNPLLIWSIFLFLPPISVHSKTIGLAKRTSINLNNKWFPSKLLFSAHPRKVRRVFWLQCSQFFQDFQDSILILGWVMCQALPQIQEKNKTLQQKQIAQLAFVSFPHLHWKMQNAFCWIPQSLNYQ